MSQRHETVLCPKCQAPATLTWDGVDSHGYIYPTREDASRLDCPNGCRLELGELMKHFPTKYADS